MLPHQRTTTPAPEADPVADAVVRDGARVVPLGFSVLVYRDRRPRRELLDVGAERGYERAVHEKTATTLPILTSRKSTGTVPAVALETDYVIELLLDEAALPREDREWLRQVRGTWLTSAQRRRLAVLQERNFQNRKEAS